MPQSSKIIFLLVQSLELLVLPVCVRGFFSKHELSIHAKPERYRCEYECE